MCPPEARLAWRWMRGQEGRPGPGTDVQSTGKTASELTRFDTTHSWTQENTAAQHTLQGGREVHILHFRGKKNQSFPVRIDVCRNSLILAQELLYTQSSNSGKVKTSRPAPTKLSNLVYIAGPAYTPRFPNGSRDWNIFFTYSFSV